MGVWRAFMKEEFKWEHVCKRNVKGSTKTKHWSNDYPEFWPRQEGWKSKQNNVTERNRSQERHSRCSPTVLEMVRYTAGSRTAVNANGRLTEPLQITVIWLSKSVIGGRRIFLTKMHYHRRQGYLAKLVTKMNEIPTTCESSVVK